MPKTFTQLSAEVARVGGLGTSADDLTSADAWAEQGLMKISTDGAFEWLRKAFEINLVADQYNYALSDIDETIWRIDSRSLRYGGRGSYLNWGQLDAIDSELEPSWRDSDGTSSTPQYATRVGLEIWVAGKPSAAFVAEHPKVEGFGWCTDNVAEDATVNGGKLLLPDPFFQAAVTAALAYGWDEEDDPRADKMLGRYQNLWLERMRSLELNVNANHAMIAPSYVYDASMGDDYGDQMG